nr:glutathione binding-like protein [Pelobacter seleniigenes]
MAAVNNELQKCLEYLNCIEQELNHAQYLAGDSITLADICAGAVLYRLTSQGLAVPLPPNVSLWYQRLQQRPGYRQWVMSDFSELKAREN